MGEQWWEGWEQSTWCDLYTFGRAVGCNKMPSPQGDGADSLEESKEKFIDPSNPFVHKLHLGPVQVQIFKDSETQFVCYKPCESSN